MVEIESVYPDIVRDPIYQQPATTSRLQDRIFRIHLINQGFTNIQKQLLYAQMFAKPGLAGLSGPI